MMNAGENNVAIEARRVGSVAVPWLAVKSRAAEPASDHLLTIPAKAGREIVENGAVIVCRLLGTDTFVKFCCERGLRIDRERLMRLEPVRIVCASVPSTHTQEQCRAVPHSGPQRK